MEVQDLFFSFEALWNVDVPLKSWGELVFWQKSICPVPCQSNYLKILLLLFRAPCQSVLESCFAERLFLTAQLIYQAVVGESCSWTAGITCSNKFLLL